MKRCYLSPISCMILTVLSAAAYASPGNSSVATWLDNAKGAYTLTTDDNFGSQVNEIGPALTQRGLVGTFFVNPSDTLASWRRYKNQYAVLAEEGHELASHTMEHFSVVPNQPANPLRVDMCMTSLDQLREDCQNVNAALTALTGKPAYTFAYPWGIDNAQTHAVLGEYFLSARDVYGQHKNSSGHFVPNPSSPENMYKLSCFLTASHSSRYWQYEMSDYEVAKSVYGRYLEDTIDAKGWAIEYFHLLDDSVDKNAYLEHLDAIAAAQLAGEVWNDTQANVSRYIYSRDAAEITVERVDDNEMLLVIDDHLDDELYNVPLTINTELPTNWSTEVLNVFHNGTPIAYDLSEEEDGATILTYNVLADGGQVLIANHAPEPSTLAMLAFLGIGVFSLASKRRKKA